MNRRWNAVPVSLLLSLGVSSAACQPAAVDCNPPQFRDEAGRCVIDCVDAPGAICDPDGGQIVGYRDAARDSVAIDSVSQPDVAPDVPDDVVTDVSRDVSGCDSGLICGGVCVAVDDPAHCGTCATRCAAPAGAHPMCNAGHCDIVCDPGYVMVGTGCEIPAPRPIGPLSTSSVTNQQPTLRWELPSGVTGASIEICPDRAFQSATCQTVAATGTSGRPTTALTRGAWFWRLHGRVGSATGMQVGPIWEFHVGARSAGDTSWGSVLDVDADGYADVAASEHILTTSFGSISVYRGGPRGLGSTPMVIDLSDPGTAFLTTLSDAGDVNGDGYADVIAGAAFAQSYAGRVYVFFGDASGLPTAPSQTFDGAFAEAYLGSGAGGVGDVNGDGFGDVLILGRMVRGASEVGYVYLGGPTGLSSTPAAVVPDPMGGPIRGSIAPVGDVDGDHVDDFLVGTTTGSGVDSDRVLFIRGNADPSLIDVSRTISAPGGANTGFATAIASAGDVDADGQVEFFVSAPGSTGIAPAAYLFGFSSGVPRSTPLATLGAPAGSSGTFGDALGGGGDFDGDGFADVAAASAGDDVVFAFSGRVSYLSQSRYTTLTDSMSSNGSFGHALSVGDVNGDGYADLVASGPDEASSARGRIVVFAGGPTGLSSAVAVGIDGVAGKERLGAVLAFRTERMGHFRRGSANNRERLCLKRRT